MPFIPYSDRPEPPPQLSELARLVHRVMEQMLTACPESSGLDDDLEWAIERLKEVESRLASHVRGPEISTSSPGELPNGRPFYRGSIFGSQHHPLFMPHDLETQDGVLHGRSNLNAVWEGPPGCVHGGYVAFLHDSIMGTHNMREGIPAMTGWLKVRYRRPTPLYTDLDFEVRTVSRSGRKILDHAEVRVAGELVSEAEGLFVLRREAV